MTCMKPVKIGFLSLFLLLLPFRLLAERPAARDEQGLFFVEVMSDKEKVVKGDSCLISFVLYASHPFEVTGVPAKMKVRNASARLLRIGRQPLQRVVKNDQVYFASVGQQYVVRTDDTGKLTVPESAFAVELSIQEHLVDPFDAFFGQMPPVKKVKLKAKSKKFEVEVVDKPKRTMIQMKQGGLEVI